MKKLLALLLSVVMLMFLFGCKDDSDDDEELTEFEILTNHLESMPNTSGQWVNNMAAPVPWILEYNTVKTQLANYFILDIRADADYNLLHLDGAVNSTVPNAYETVKNATKPVLVVCYSGQTAAFTHMLLRLKGVEAYSMKWGMSIVDKTLDKITPKCSNQYAAHANWEKTASAALPKFDWPTLSTGKATGQEILDDRVNTILTTGLTALQVTAADVVPTPENYHILCYWSQADWDAMGHIKTAYRLEPKTLTKALNLSAFNPTGTNVVYCYTGQTSGALTGFLNVIGYNVKSLSFGANSMIYDTMTVSKWPKPW